MHKCPSDLICKGGPIPCVLEVGWSREKVAVGTWLVWPGAAAAAAFAATAEQLQQFTGQEVEGTVAQQLAVSMALRLRSFNPCLPVQYDDTCSASDNSCLDWNDFCLGGWRYTCPEGYR